MGNELKITDGFINLGCAITKAFPVKEGGVISTNTEDIKEVSFKKTR